MLVRAVVSALGAGVVFFLGGWVIFGLLLRSYFEGAMSPSVKAVTNQEPNFAPLILAQLTFGLLFSYILVRWASVRSFVGGLAVGFPIMFLMSLGWDLQMLAFYKEMYVGSPVAPILVDAICAGVLGALAGGTIGLINGVMDKSPAPDPSR